MEESIIAIFLFSRCLTIGNKYVVTGRGNLPPSDPFVVDESLEPAANDSESEDSQKTLQLGD